MEDIQASWDADERDDAFRRLRKLYPELTDEQLKEAFDNLRRYAELLVRVQERLKADPEAARKFRRLVAEQRVKEDEGEGKENDDDEPGTQLGCPPNRS